MAGPPIDIRSAGPDEIDPAVAALVAAFLTDPIARFAWSSPRDHLLAMPRVAHALGGAAFACGTAYVSADLCGTALWLPPGAHSDGEALEAITRETTVPEHLDDLLATFDRMASSHPDEPHWYLPLVGVEPWSQGKGLGGALMRHAVERCDREGALAYLESSNPRNIPLYERHGFVVQGEIQVGAGPRVTPMLRHPR